MNRLCIFAHYDRDNLVDDYVFFYLRNLKSVCGKLVFVTTSNLDETEKTSLKAYCDLIISRENRGYDFMSWQAGLRTESLSGYDEVVICNDSVYGPLFPLEEAFDGMSKKVCDFWGMTDSHQISYHLQSYFLVFRKPVIISPAFLAFWKDITTQKSKKMLIRTYEVGLSRVLLEAGFKAGVYAGYSPSLVKRFLSLIYLCGNRIARGTAGVRVGLTEKSAQTSLPAFFHWAYKKMRHILKGKDFNVTHQFWKELIVRYRMPFLKIELLRDNPTGVNIGNIEPILRLYSNYNTAFITSHLQRITGDNAAKTFNFRRNS